MAVILDDPKEDFIRVSCKDHEEWLHQRLSYEGYYLIGASEAAAVAGYSPFQGAADVFDTKVRGEVKDISSLPSVKYGVEAESPMRQIAMLDFEKYFRFEYHPFDILVSRDRPFLSATLDGEITVINENNPWGFPLGAKGIYEGKTGSSDRGYGSGWKIEGRNTVPTHYYMQNLHQMYVTGWLFVIDHFRLKRDGYRDGEQELPQVKEGYRLVDRRNEGVLEEMSWLIDQETAFSRGHLQTGIRPDAVIRF